MCAARIANWFDNAGSPSNSQQYGPFPLGTVQKLLAVNVTGHILLGPSVISTSSFDNIPIIYGVQVVDSGASPLTLPADEEDPGFLAIRSFAEGSSSASWAPNTDDAGWLGIVPFSLHWGGQPFFGVALDLYVTFGNTFTSSAAWVSAGWFESYST